MTFRRMGVYCAEFQVLTDLARLSNSNAPVISSTQVRSGTRSYRTTNDGCFGHSENPGVATCRMGCALYQVSVPPNNAFLYYAGNGLELDDITNHLFVRLNMGVGTISIMRPSASNTWETLYTHNGVPAEFSTTAAWFTLGVRHEIHATTGFISLYVGGQLIFTYTGDTRPANYNGSTQVFATTMQYMLGPGAFNGTTGLAGTHSGWDDAYIDDMYFDEASGEADDFIPARRFNALFPTGVGANAEWTPSAGANWQNVDDNPNDGTTTENATTVDQEMDTFVFSDFTLPANHAIVQVLPMPFARQLDTGAGLTVHAYDGVTYQHSAELVLPTGYQRPVFAVMPTQPDSSDWNETDLNAMQFGYRAEI